MLVIIVSDHVSLKCGLEAPNVRLCGNGPGWPITGLTVAGSAHSTGRGHLHSRERRTVDQERTSRIK